MERSPGESSSDSELSDGWTILCNKSSMQNVQNSENIEEIINSNDNIEEINSSEYSDLESLEALENVNQEVPTCLETDSDGISVISEYDGGVKIEAIPIAAVSRERKYVHHPNDHVNSVLSLILAITVATVFGLGVGHYLGTQEGHDTIDHLQMENQLLQSQLQTLLKENELLKNKVANDVNSRTGTSVVSRNIPEKSCLKNGISKCSEEIFPNDSVNTGILFRTSQFLSSLNIPTSIDYFNMNLASLDQNPTGNKMPPNNYLQLEEKVEQNTENMHDLSPDKQTNAFEDDSKLKVDDQKNNIKVSDTTEEKNIELPISNPQNIQNDIETIDESKSLVDVMKTTIFSGSELSTKLKDTLSQFQSVFTDWKQISSSNIGVYRDKVNHFWKDSFKQMEHVFADGGKIQNKLFKLLDKFETFQRSFPEECQLSSSKNKKWCIDKSDNIVKVSSNTNKDNLKSHDQYMHYKSDVTFGPTLPNGNYYSNVFGPQLPKGYYKSESSIYKDNKKGRSQRYTTNRKCHVEGKDACKDDTRKRKSGKIRAKNGDNIKKDKVPEHRKSYDTFDRYNSDDNYHKYKEQFVKKSSKYPYQRHDSKEYKNTKYGYDMKKLNKLEEKLNRHSSNQMHRYQPPPNHKYKSNAWTIDENGHKTRNMSGEWLMKLHSARAKHRENNKSDWVFERAISRKMRRDEDRDKSRWYFMRGRSREYCRRQPQTDSCRVKENSCQYCDKIDNEYIWKKHHNYYEDNQYDHSSRSHRDWRSRHAEKHWNPKKFISEAFLTATKFFKA